MNDSGILLNDSKLRMLLLILLAEVLIFFYSGVGFSFLYSDGFFSIGVDPLAWLFYSIKIPQTITGHYWLGAALDCLLVVLLCILIYNPYKNRIAFLLLLLMICFYLTITGYLTHRNYQTGLFLILFPFIFKAQKSKWLAFEGLRYFLLFFYFSSAILKIYNHSFKNVQQFSVHLTNQFSPYFVEGNTGIRTQFNLFLIHNPGFAYYLFIAAFIAELICIIGFFTKKYDSYLCIILLLFHFTNWFIMDIAPIGQLAFISLLFISRNFKK